MDTFDRIFLNGYEQGVGNAKTQIVQLILKFVE